MHPLPSMPSFSLGQPPGLDVFAFKDRLHALFSRYGRVLRLDLVRADQGQERRVMCFLRMSTPLEEQAVVDALGLGRFGGDLVMVLPLHEAQPVPGQTPLAWSAPGHDGAGRSGWR